jgi:hypothetical protein
MVIWNPDPFVVCPQCNRVNYLKVFNASGVPSKPREPEVVECCGCRREHTYCGEDVLPIIPTKEWKAGRHHLYSIYLLVNSLNDLIYVGRTKKGLATRMGQYRDWCRANPRTVSRPIHCAMQEIGVDAFDMILLEDVNSDTRENRERFWIDHLDALNPLKGYNRA